MAFQSAMLRLIPLLAAGATLTSAEGGVEMLMQSPQDESTLRLYDCHAEYDIWETAWTPDWKAWCCAHEQRGCPSTTTSTATSSTSTTRTATSTTRTATATTSATSTTRTATATTTSAGCEVPCELKGIIATCSARVQWASKHDTLNSTRPCEAAHALVVDQCSVCSGCSLEAVRCEPQMDKEFFFRKRLQRKFESPAGLLQVSPETQAAHGLFTLLCVAAVSLSLALLIVLRRAAGPREEEQAYIRAGDEECDLQ